VRPEGVGVGSDGNGRSQDLLCGRVSTFFFCKDRRTLEPVLAPAKIRIRSAYQCNIKSGNRSVHVIRKENCHQFLWLQEHSSRPIMTVNGC
jgi:hypothetical protein